MPPLAFADAAMLLFLSRHLPLMMLIAYYIFQRHYHYHIFVIFITLPDALPSL